MPRNWWHGRGGLTRSVAPPGPVARRCDQVVRAASQAALVFGVTSFLSEFQAGIATLFVVVAMPFVVIAHRGNSSLHPENTMAAFDAALTTGTSFELDVQMTR